jgi:hypothetical protein
MLMNSKEIATLELLMARSCMRAGKVLQLSPMDVEGCKAVIRGPKSGRDAEGVFLLTARSL